MLRHIFGSGATRLPGRLLAASAAIFLTLASQSPSRADGPPAGVAAKLIEASGKLAALWADPAAKTPIIVEFGMPPIPDAASFDTLQAGDRVRTDAIHGAQDAILRAWLGSPAAVAVAQATPGTNLKRMAYTPLFGVVASAADIEKLSADPRVVRIHEDRISDPLLKQSRSLIGMDNAYIQGADGNNFHVAILDTGGRRSHEFLSRQIVSAACYSTTSLGNGSTSLCPGQIAASTAIDSADDCDSSSANGCSHGTHVAGIAAGFNTNQQAGEVASGVAREARIISINVFSLFPGPEVRSFTTDQIQGLERVYALRTTLNIGAVNMSLGGGQVSAACDGNPLKFSIDLLRAARIATVIAAGNDGFDASVSEPGCISSAITVASSTKVDVRSSFSNWGTLVDVVAPGSDILSSYVSGGNVYASLNGTSMAAPHVAGAITALRSARPWATIDQIEAALESTGLGIASAGVTKPRIRVDLALNQLPSTPPPANDTFASRTSKAVGTSTGSNINASAETGEPVHAGRANARNSVWWTYTPPSNGTVTINTIGSSFDTVLAVYTGTAVNGLTPVASNDDIAPGNVPSQVTFQGTAGVPYAMAVAGDENAFGTISLTVQFAPSNPAPGNDNFASRFTVAAPGTVTGTNVGSTAETGEPLHAGLNGARTSVWWRYTPSTSGTVVIDTFGSNFDTVLAVYSGTTLTGLTPIASNDEADTGAPQSQVTFQGTAGTAYAIAVAGFTNATGAVTLKVALTPTPPANDNFANRVTIAAPGTVTGSNANATAETGEPLHAGLNNARTSVWWRYTPSTSGTVVIDTLGSNFDTVLAVYTGNAVGALTPIASNDEEDGGSNQSRVTFQGTAGTVYAIAVAGFTNATGAINLTVALTPSPPPAPINDNFANRVTIAVPATVSGSNVNATAETGEPNHAGNGTARTSVWWRITPTATGQIVIRTAGSGFDTVLAVYTGNAVGALTPVASNDDTGGTLQSQVTFQATAGISYAIAVAGKANATGPITLAVTLGTPPPGPANNNFANRVTVPVPGTVSGSNVNATAETGEPNHAGVATARTSVWWRITPSATGQVVIRTAGSGFDTVLAVYTGNAVGALTPVASNDDTGGTLQSQVAFQGTAGVSYAIAVAGKANATGPITLAVTAPPASQTTIFSAVSPVARATPVGGEVTAFASVINAGSQPALSCSIGVPGGRPLTFSYRSRNQQTGALGPANQPVNVAVGAREDFVMFFTPTGAIQQELALIFDCANTAPATSVLGLNTFLLTGTTGPAPADLISIAVTPTNDGIMNVPLGGTGFAALAALNIGGPATIQARLSASSILSPTTSLPATMVVCQTNSTTGACLAPPAATVSFTVPTGQIVTMTAFVASNGTAIPFDPAGKRLFVHFFQGTVPVGSASVAARTVAPDLATLAAK